jgi:hypothetical protein
VKGLSVTIAVAGLIWLFQGNPEIELSVSQSVQEFKEQIIASGLEASRVFAYADTFPDLFLNNNRWNQHLEFFTNAALLHLRELGIGFGRQLSSSITCLC